MSKIILFSALDLLSGTNLIIHHSLAMGRTGVAGSIQPTTNLFKRILGRKLRTLVITFLIVL